MSRAFTDTFILQKSAANRAAKESIWGKQPVSVLERPAVQRAVPASPAVSLPAVGGGVTVGDRAARIFHLPYPPSVNSYWRNVKVNKAVLSDGAKAYRIAVLAAVGPCMPLRGRLVVSVSLFPPDKRQRDIDNVAKALFDALQHACVYKNDEQIDEFTIKRMPIIEGGACSVFIQQIPMEAPMRT